MAKSEKIFNIGWDCDGVLLKSYQPVLEAANYLLKSYGATKVLVKSDLSSWESLSKYTLSLTNNPELAKTVSDLWYSSEILNLSPPNLAATKVFNQFQNLPNTEQYLITTRKPHCRQCTIDTLSPYLNNFDWSRLLIRSESDQLSGDDFKTQMIGNYGIHIMNEDNINTVSRIQMELPKCRISYFNQPWNSEDKDPVRTQFRVDFDDIDQIYQRILEVRQQFYLS